jgi:hypothetical protein
MSFIPFTRTWRGDFVDLSAFIEQKARIADLETQVAELSRRFNEHVKGRKFRDTEPGSFLFSNLTMLPRTHLQVDEALDRLAEKLNVVITQESATPARLVLAPKSKAKKR